MRAESNYWTQAAQYVQSASGVHYLREGKLLMNYQATNIDYTIHQKFNYLPSVFGCVAFPD